MPDSLLFSVRLHEGWYHGSDLIPSPARLFQALVAGRGLRGPLDDADVAALRFLEQLPAPTVAAPTSKSGQTVVTYVPNNDLDAVRGDHRRMGKIRTQKRIASQLFNADVPFRFSWELPAERDDAKVNHLIEMADGIYQLGRTVDAAWGWAEVVSDDALQNLLRRHRGPVRRPASGTGQVECPMPGSLDSLIRRYSDMALRYGLTEDRKGQTFRRRSKPKWRRISYDAGTTFLHFDLVDLATDHHFAWAHHRPTLLVERIRDAAVSRLNQGLPERELDINATLIGRRPDGSGSGPTSARVRIVPLPSVGFEHADRRIRRVVVEIPGSCVFSVNDIAWAFSGLSFKEGASRLTLVRSQQNAQAKYYGIERESSSAWQTTTPIVLTPARRRRIEPDRLKRTDADLKGTIERNKELSQAHKALRNSLRQAGVTARVRAVKLQREPFEARGQRVEEFAADTRFDKHSLWHARIEFDRDEPGPLVVGDGRFLGLGVMSTWSPQSATSGIFAFDIVEGMSNDADGIRICAAVRRAVMSRVRDVLRTSQIPAYFTGHSRNGSPADSRTDPHLFFACDVRSARILILSPDVVEPGITNGCEGVDHRPTLRAALTNMHVVRTGIDGVLHLKLNAVNTAHDDLFTRSLTWKSVTRYTVNRHGRNQTAESIIVRDVESECVRRGLPRARVNVLDWSAVKGIGLQAELALEFPNPVAGPILIGRTRHKGGGLFRGTTKSTEGK